MKSSIQQSKCFRPTGHKLVLALALASVISSLSITPVLADGDEGNGRGYGHGNRHGHHSQGERRGDNEGYYGYQNEYRQPYVYAEPVYVPPPVYYEPRPSAGISLFFPLDLR